MLILPPQRPQLAQQLPPPPPQSYRLCEYCMPASTYYSMVADYTDNTPPILHTLRPGMPDQHGAKLGRLHA